MAMNKTPGLQDYGVITICISIKEYGEVNSVRMTINRYVTICLAALFCNV